MGTTPYPCVAQMFSSQCLKMQRRAFHINVIVCVNTLLCLHRHIIVCKAVIRNLICKYTSRLGHVENSISHVTGKKNGVTILVSCIRVNTSPPTFFIHARVRIFTACFQSTALSDTVGKNSTCQQQFCLKTHIYHNNEALTEPLVHLEPDLVVFFIC